MIVEVLVVGQCAAGVGDGEFALVEVPELHAGTVVGSFHAAVELRAPWRQDVQWDVESLLLKCRVQQSEAYEMAWRLGLDIGTNSIGWAAFSLDGQNRHRRPSRLISSGVRIFSDGRNPKDRQSNAVARRLPRQQRRSRDRYLKRRHRFMEALI